ncbi:hypothetical protein ACHAQA_007140 [Verticillium albo-atrum]
MKFLAQLSVIGTMLSIVSASPGHSGHPVKNCKAKGGEQMVPWDAKYVGPYLLNPMYQSPPGFGPGGPGHGGPGHGGPGHEGPGHEGPGAGPGTGPGVSPSPGPGAGPGLGATPEVGLGGCFGCLITVAKEVPCIYNAIKGGGFSALLQCGVGKSDICDCINCLPDALSKYVAGFCSSNEGEGVTPTLELADDNFVANADDNVKAFLGLLSPAELQALKEKAEAANPPRPEATGGLTAPNPTGNGTVVGCVIGSDCGGCCCVGVCVLNSCIGGCF